MIDSPHLLFARIKHAADMEEGGGKVGTIERACRVRSALMEGEGPQESPMILQMPKWQLDYRVPHKRHVSWRPNDGTKSRGMWGWIWKEVEGFSLMIWYFAGNGLVKENVHWATEVNTNVVRGKNVWFKKNIKNNQRNTSLLWYVQLKQTNYCCLELFKGIDLVLNCQV